MLTDYYARSLYEKTLDKAGQLYHAGNDAERMNQYSSAQQNYEMSLSRYKNCYELGKSYEDSGCMKESKQGIDKAQDALDRVKGRAK